MTDIVSKPDYGEKIIEDQGLASNRFQLYLDDIERKLNIPILPSFTVSQLTTDILASSRLNGIVMVSDETGGQQPAFSDGLNWRRFTDRAVIS